MLDVETRRRIDAARDILVGKVPDPKSQVEQITLALMYKFMDDIDVETEEEHEGNAIFFVGDFAQYSWRRLVGGGLGAVEMLELYEVGLRRMGQNPRIPVMFQDTFKNAYLPFRDPETLRLFLQVIDEFKYDNSERLGDAFEYLLSIMDSQGDAGQFRTPRHIIDFIVEIVDPRKDDIILDPACGTAGFLISAYKHIAKSNEDAETPLTPPERTRLAGNISGYDISPDMVRLSLVNLFLHRFPAPNIDEYDTLTSEDRWNEYANVILANPPFMSPKGGIRPHNRFGVKSKRSEVLFVDYIAEHLTAAGRAGVIVPEGINSRSQNAYKQLRKMLVEDYLVAVISLPPGVFNPYSVVKTSVLIMDKSLARRSDTIGFFKVENDGFDLGAQRRPIDRDDLPAVKGEVTEYLRRVREGDEVGEFAPEHGLIVEKERIGADGEFNLSGERYSDSAAVASEYPYVPVERLFQRSRETVLPASLNGRVTYIGLENLEPHTGELTGQLTSDQPATIKSSKNVFSCGDILYGKLRPNLNKVWFADRDGICSSDIFVIQPTNKDVVPEFYEHVFRSKQFNEEALKRLSGAQLPRINWQSLTAIEVPLPPLEVQREIVSEIEGYQRVIDGARAVVENWRPRIAVDPEWPLVELGANGLFEVVSGGTPKSNVNEYWDGDIPWITLVDLPAGDTITEITTTQRTISEEGLRKSAARMLPANSVVVSSRATIGRVGINRMPLCTNQGFKNVVIKDPERAIPEYIAVVLTKLVPEMEANASGSTYKEIIKSRFSRLTIPLPSFDIQQDIVGEIQAEREMVDANRRLIERMEGKVRDVVGRVWAEG